jgi:hypothetical protein
MNRVYARMADLSNPLRQMLEAWAAHCDRIEPIPAGTVVPFTAVK